MQSLRFVVLAGYLALGSLSCDRAAPVSDPPSDQPSDPAAPDQPDSAESNRAPRSGPPASPASEPGSPNPNPNPNPDPGPGPGPNPNSAQPPLPIAPPGEPFDRVLADLIPRITAIPIGSGTVADIALPPSFLHRLATRTFLETYRHQLHGIGVDPGAAPPPTDAPPLRSADRPTKHDDLQIRYAKARSESPEAQRPARRGFRAGLPGESPNLPTTLTPAERACVDLITRELAPRGLARTLARILQTTPDWTAEEAIRLGFPVDLLAGFDADNDARSGFRRLAERTAALGPTPTPEAWQDLESRLARLPWTPRPAHGFTADSDSGQLPIEHIRMQVTRGAPWRNEPEGGDSLALARQVLDALPYATAEIALEADFVAPFLDTYRHWSSSAAPRSLLAVPLPVAQWAQDNARPGRVNEERAILLPRYASRRDEGSLYIPGESAVTLDPSETAVRSMLLFQGGNIIITTHPVHGERIALIGEAEIVRNLALGLSPDEVIRAFTAELQVDRTLVLPALSFHIDYDVSVRAVGDELIAFVNDPETAAVIILRCAIDPLTAAGRLPPELAATVRHALDSGNLLTAHQTLHQAVNASRLPNGFVRLSVADQFSVGAGDNGVGNVQRLLLALDLVGAATGSTTRWPEARLESAVHAALHEEAALRSELEAELTAAGFRVVQVPSIAAESRGITLINAVHTPDRLVTGAWGGLYSPLDAAAAAVFREAVGPEVLVIPIRDSESQRRSGSVHCSVATYRTLDTR